MSTERFPDVIFLNGGSCAGKTTLALELLNRIEQPFIHLGVDHFVGMLPLRYFGKPEGIDWYPQPDGTVPVRLGDIAYRLIEVFHRTCRACVGSRLGVVVDDTLLEPRMLEDWLEVLRGVDVMFVSIRCQLEELVRRETERPERVNGCTAASHEAVHAHGLYDLTLDTTNTPSSECADKVLAAIASNAPRTAFERLRSTGYR